ncbi:MAG: peptidoglycan-binding protein [Saprospiraceae bacterium]|nr:peptidoglycan-binding protein [Saprospiraceae bacterium]
MAHPTLRLYDGYNHTSPHLRDAVKELQSQLKRYGYRIKADGGFGPYTENVVRLFQSSKGLVADGVVGPSTWASLLRKPAPANPETAYQTSYAKWDRSLLKQLEELKKYGNTVKKVAQKYDIPPAVIAGIGSRESHWGLALTPPGPSGTGDHGHGRGLLQIDDRWHVPFVESGKWAVAKENIVYGAAVLKNCMNYFVKKAGWKPGFKLIKAGCAGYNCGPRRAWDGYRMGYGVDYYTTGRNYSKDVLERAGWFQLHGW